MSKAIKRTLRLVLSMLLLFSAVSLSALAAPEEERVAVYVQVPSDWEDPCLWAWDEDGNNAFEAWPGGEMDADSANEGWYYIWIPAWANHVIVNANEGSVQTGEVVLDGKDAWITVKDAETVELSQEKLTEGETPEYVEKFIVHAKVDESWTDPCLWAWSAPDGTNAFEAWPGFAMKEGENGWYSAKAPVWVNSIIINGNEGNVQTEDISIDPAEIWVTVEADGSYDFSYVDPDKEAVPNVTVHVMAPADWEGPCLWAWSAPDGTNVYSTWPGEAFAEGENGWLEKEIPGWVNSVIVNGNEGSVQTSDISVETGKDLWLVVKGPEEYELSYEVPEVSGAPVEEAAVAETADASEAADAAETQDAAAGEAAEPAGTKGAGAAPVVAVIVVIVAAAGAGVYWKKKKAGGK
ncbi:MAG: starch-binding protein [Eubacteriales bacterium]|nr:starch-binding protein [Eubacteriales bacterium]